MVRKVAVVGGGAAGMMAAIMAARNGAAVTLYERNDRVGKKILSTGNGKCNFSNRDFSVAYYYGNERKGSDAEKMRRCFAQFSVSDAVDFFETAGMLVKDKRGYLYPWSEQAATVLDILRLESEQSGVEVRNLVQVTGVERNKKEKLVLQPSGQGEAYDAVILACGGCAAGKTGSDGNGYRLAEQMGHRVVPTVPALVQLRCSDAFFKIVAGVRCEAALTLCAMKHKGQEELSQRKVIQEEVGELQFTDYGISGIPVFQLSRQAAYLLREKKAVTVYIDLFPGMGSGTFEAMCGERLQRVKGKTMEEWLLGMANKKVNQLMLKLAGRKPADAAETVGQKQLKRLLYSYRELAVHVEATNPFENAQVTAGGVALSEVTDAMESVKLPGVYFAGEILDVDGRCGGYNLQWAWTSGAIAGKHAALGDRK